MYYMLCCDISTLRCKADDVERVLSEFSTRYHKVSDSLWLFCTRERPLTDASVAPHEYVITHLLRKYTTPESSLFSFRIPSNGFYWELPDDAEEFFSVDEPDD